MDKRDDEIDDAVMHADDTGMLREQHEIIQEEILGGKDPVEPSDP